MMGLAMDRRHHAVDILILIIIFSAQLSPLFAHALHMQRRELLLLTFDHCDAYCDDDK